MRALPATHLIGIVDDWWTTAQYRSPHDPEATKARAEMGNPEPKKSLEQRLREKQQARNLKKDVQ